MVPEHQVAGEEDPGDGREPDRLPRQRTVASPLPERHEHEQRQPEDGAVERAGRRRDRREQVEDPRERDARRAEQRRESWPLREPVERPEARRLSPRVSPLRSCPGRTPTKRRPSSSYCPGSGIEGASSIRSVPDWVLGNAITSRMFVCWASSAAQRSMPSAIPPCGGAPYSKASRTAPNFSRIPSSVWPWSRNERSRRSRRWIRIEPPPSSQPLSARSYWSARARPAGSSGDGCAGIARRRHEQLLVLGQDAAERVVGRVPAADLGVPLVHREAIDPDVGEHVRVGQAETVAELDAQPAEDVGGHLRRVGDDQDQVALGRGGLLDDRALRVVRQELGDRALDLAAGLEREVGQALRPEPSGALGQLVDLAPGDAGHPGRDDRLDPAAGRQGVVEHLEPRRRRAVRPDEHRAEVDQLHPEADVRLVRAEPLDAPPRR